MTDDYMRKPISVITFDAKAGAYRIQFAEDNEKFIEMPESHLVMCNMFLSMFTGRHDKILYRGNDCGKSALLTAYDGNGTHIASLVLSWSRSGG